MAKQDRNNDRNSYGAGFIMGVRYPNKYGTMLNATGIERAEEKKFEKADRQDERKNGVKFVWEYDLNGTYRNTGRPDFTDTNREDLETLMEMPCLITGMIKIIVLK